MSTHQSWLITGASSGLGASLAIEVLRSGVKHVVGVTRNTERARTTQPEFERLGGVWLALDVTAGAECEKIVRETVDKYDIDVLVNCAGIALLGALEDIR